MKLFYALLFITALSAQINGYKILGLIPTMAKSHWIVGSALMKELARQGHEVTVISPFPLSKPMENYKNIENDGIFDLMPPTLLDMANMSVTESINNMYELFNKVTNFTLNHQNLKKLINSNEKFDLIIMEIFLNDALLGLSEVFNAPVIGLSTFGASKMSNDLIGSPTPLSYVPHPFLSFTDKMSFTERYGNTLMTIFENVYDKLTNSKAQEVMFNKAFPNAKKSLDQLKREVSLVLLNTHFSLSYPRPYVPNMIEVGGMHINREAKPLPEDLKAIIENSKNGVIYFSMGSNIKSSTLPAETVAAIIKVFAGLKETVLWKWETEDLPGKPKNVFVQKWFPQDDVLAHPNVKAFITHGGLLSSTEAIYHGVPIVGIPIFGDQPLNMARAEKAGYGIMVSYKNLTETSLKWAVREILDNKKYNVQAKIIQKRFRDQPLAPLETAVFWVEYVCRHKGAPHLHSAGQDLSWIQYHNVDVFTVMFLLVTLPLYLLLKGIKSLFAGKKTKTTSKKNGKKNN